MCDVRVRSSSERGSLTGIKVRSEGSWKTEVLDNNTVLNIQRGVSSKLPPKKIPSSPF